MKMTSEYSNFENGELYVPHNYEDPTDRFGTIISNLRKNAQTAFLDNKLSNQKNAFFAMSQAIEINNNSLQKFVLTTKVINQISEELRNLEIYARDYNPQHIFYESVVPQNLQNDDIWIGDQTL